MKLGRFLTFVLLLSISVLGQNPGQEKSSTVAKTTAQRLGARGNSAHTARPEEILIRTAYAKMSYADEVRIIVDELLHNDQWWKTPGNVVDAALGSRLTFQLSDFKFGKISEIADRRIGDFDGSATAIGGEVLDVTESLWNYSVDNSPSEYVAYIKFAWKPSPYRTVLFPENWPVAFALRTEQFEGKRYTDYVTYQVTVTFKGKSRTYNAWMLFGPDNKGKRQIYFMDSVADPTAIHFALEHSLFPAAFLSSNVRTVPFVSNWLHSNAQSCTAPQSEKDNNRLDVCCDPETARCGVPESLLFPASAGRLFKSPARILPTSFHPLSPAVHPFFQSSGCSQFNFNPAPFNHGLGDSNEHITGQHNFVASVQGSCTYTDGNNGRCNTTCVANSSSTMADFGDLSGFGTFHATAKADFTGQAAANNATTGTSCQGTSAGTVRSCFGSCSTSISITAAANGVGATINFPANQIWSDQNQAAINCAYAVASGGGSGGGCTPDPGTMQSGQVGYFVQTDPNDPPPPCTVSPIIIDTQGEGFHLTSADAGVAFDITGTGHPIQMGWTDPQFHNAFLALPGADGLVHNGKQLFGNFTPQPQSPHPNGFLALAEFDKPENGGNGDGMIDEKDAVYSKLRLWIDENHDGVCQRNELHLLSQLGVYSLALNYFESRRTDQFGDLFRYKARVDPGERRDPLDATPSGDPGRWAYDVFFVTK